MPAQTKKDLYLQVSGDVTPLQAAMKAGRSALLQLADAAGDVQAEVQRQFEKLGGESIASAAKQMEANFDRSFAAIRRNAQAVADAPTPRAAFDILGAQRAEDVAARAEASAASLRMVADAAATVSARLGEGATANRAYAVAAELAALKAEEEATGLRAQATALAPIAAELRANTVHSDEASEAAARVAGAHGRMSIAGMEAEHVIRSLSDSIAAGQSPFRAMSMELPRTAEALMFFAQDAGETEGALGKVAAFLRGPWGLAFTAAAAIMGPLIGKLFETDEAANKALEGMRSFEQKELELPDLIDKTTGKLKDQVGVLNQLADVARQVVPGQITDAQTQAHFAQVNAFKAARDKLASEGHTRAGPRDAALSAAIYNSGGRPDQPNAGSLKALNSALQVLLPSRPDLAALARTVADAYGQELLSMQKVQDLHGQQYALDRVKGGGAILTPESVRRTAEDVAADSPAARAQARVRDIEARIETIGRKPVSDAQQVEMRKALGELTVAMREAKNATSNRETGRTVTVDEAKAIIEGIGGHVTSTVRTREQQQGLYDKYVAYREGRGPWAPLAAKPGTSLHEAGNGIALDFTGVSLGAVRQAFAAKGVHLSELLNEGNHGHVGIRAKGPSQETLDKRDRAAEVKGDNQDREFESQLAQANSRIARASLGLADTVEQRLKVDLDELAFAKAARDKEIADSLKAGKYGDPKSKLAQDRAAQLTTANNKAFDAEGDLAKKKEADAVLDRQLGILRDELSGQINILQLQSDLALTNKDRLALARQILDRQEQEARATLTERIEKEDDPKKKDAFKLELANVTPDFALRRQQADRQYADPMASYKLSLQESVGDMNSSLKGVEVDGLKGLENGLLGIVGGTESAASAFRKMTLSMLADLEKLAVEKLLFSVLGLKDGGEAGGGTGSGGSFLGGLLHLAGGGEVFGPGGPRDDRVPALLSHGEYVVNAAAYARHPQLVEAINTGRLPRFANGGLVGTVDPASIYMRELPSAASVARPGGGGSITFDMRGAVVTEDLLRQMHDISAKHAMVAIVAGSQQAQQDMAEHAMARIPG